MVSVLKNYRLQRGLTQVQLAKRVGTSQAQIYRLENSERKLTVEWAERLAQVLSTTAEKLLFGNHSVRDPVSETLNSLPVDAQSVLTECLAFTDALEQQSGRILSCAERAAYIIKFYNIYLETGQLPKELDSLRVASMASVIYANDISLAR